MSEETTGTTVIPSLRRTANALGTAIAVLVLAAFVIQAVPAVIGADASYVVLSGSMEPTISGGDVVIVNSVDPTTIERGDVITFTRGTSAVPVTHRVVDIRNGEEGLVFETKGDANENADPEPVDAEQITGEVWFAIPYIGHVILFASTPTGLAVLLGIPILGFVASELYLFARGGVSAESAETASAGDNDGRNHEGEEAENDDPDHASEGESHVDESDADQSHSPDSKGIVLTGMDLKMSAGGFGPLAAYSGFVVYQRPEPVHVGVFVAASIVVAFLAVVLIQDLRWFESADSADEGGSSTQSATEALTDGGGSSGSNTRGDDDDQ